MKKLTRTKKPPLGTKPTWFYDDDIKKAKLKIDIKYSLLREKELREAIIRYVNEHRSIDIEWIKEYNEHIKFLNNKNYIKEEIK